MPAAQAVQRKWAAESVVAASKVAENLNPDAGLLASGALVRDGGFYSKQIHDSEQKPTEASSDEHHPHTC